MKKLLGLMDSLPSERKFKSTIKLADFVVKTVASAVPGAPLVYDLTKISYEWSRDYVQIRNERRLAEFYQVLLYQDEMAADFSDRSEWEEADFHALLSACVNDVDAEKTVPYGLLTKAIGRGGIPVDHRRFFISLLKNMEFGQLDILRNTYVLTKYSCRSDSNKPVHVSAFLSAPSGLMNSLFIADLERKGLISNNKITLLGISFVKSCSLDDDLYPGTYGYKNSKDERAVVVALQESAYTSYVSDALVSELISRGIHTEKTHLFDISDADIHFSKNIFVIASNSKFISADLRASLNASIGEKKFMQIFCDGEMDSDHSDFMDAPSRSFISSTIDSQASEAVDHLLSL